MPARYSGKSLSIYPHDVYVYTSEEFREMEVRYWNKTTPIGYIFTFGAIMGLVVGFIIVYQILFADVQDHLKEYAHTQKPWAIPTATFAA